MGVLPNFRPQKRDAFALQRSGLSSLELGKSQSHTGHVGKVSSIDVHVVALSRMPRFKFDCGNYCSKRTACRWESIECVFQSS